MARRKASGIDPELDRAQSKRISHWTAAQHAVHTAEARPLAVLARERRDLQVYMLEEPVGVVEVHADEGG